MGFLDDIRAKHGTPKPVPVASTAPVLTSLDGATTYALEALNRECAQVSMALEGTRNDTLNIAAFNLAQLAAGGQLPPTVVVQELTNAARQAGLTDTEILPTLNSGLRKGEEHPRYPDTKEESWLSNIPTTTPVTASAPSPWETAPANAPQTSAGKPSTTSSMPWERMETPPPPASATSPEPTSSGSAPTNGSETARAEPVIVGGVTLPPADRISLETSMEYLKLKAREQAQRMLKAEKTAATAPDPINLTTFLATPDEDVLYRIHGLLPAGGRVILAAQYKAGKSSMIGNLIKSLADATDFLDRFPVEPTTRISIIDNELDPRTLRRWLRDQQIQNTDSINVLSLRGAVSTFDILDPETRAQWATKIAGSDIVILDCLRPVLDALGLSEDKDAGRFLVAFDALLEEAGATEAVIVHHMGHTGSRSRGDSRILDWPDATWTLKREDPEDPNSTRFFEALGRDVKVNEAQLGWDEPSRHLSIVGGSRNDKHLEGKLEQILDFLEYSPGTSGRGIKTGIPGADKTVPAAIELGIERGLIERRDRPGRGGGWAYYLTEANRGEVMSGISSGSEEVIPFRGSPSLQYSSTPTEVKPLSESEPATPEDELARRRKKTDDDQA